MRYTFVLGVAILATAGCTKSSLSGNVYLTYGAGDVKPIAGTEVHLWAGSEEEFEREVGTSFVAWADNYLSRRSTRNRQSDMVAHKAQLDNNENQILELSNNYSWAEANSAPNCNVVGKTIFADLIARVVPEGNSQALLSKLNEREAANDAKLRLLQSQLREDMMSGIDNYLRENVGIVVMGDNGSGDLIVHFSNTGDLAIRWLRISISVAGHKLVEESREIDFSDKNRRNSRREKLFGLGPGESMAVGLPISRSVDRLTIRRLSKRDYASPDIAFDDASLSDTLRRMPDNSSGISYPKNSLPERYIPATSKSLDANIDTLVSRMPEISQDIEIVEKFLGACDQLAKLHQVGASISTRLDNLVDQTSAKPSNQERIALAKTIAIRNGVQATLSIGRVEEIIAEAEGDAEYFNSGDRDGELALNKIYAELLNSADAARTTIGGAFVFPEVVSGDHILISGTNVNNSDEVWWFVPISVAGPAAQDLANFNLAEGSLSHHLATFAIGHLQESVDISGQ